MTQLHPSTLEKLKLVAFDPGVNAGIAFFDREGNLLEMKILRGFKEQDECFDELESLRGSADEFIFLYERYRAGFSQAGLQSKKFSQIHGGKANQTEQSIGSFLRTARRLSARVEHQDSQILVVAQLHSGMKIPSNHDQSHHVAAYNHGYEWLLRKKIIKPRVLRENK